MKTIKHIAGIVLGVLALSSFFGFVLKNTNENFYPSEKYTIAKVWKLPEVLREISGISWIDNHTIASVQDEDGIIFIFDLEKNKIIKQIQFAGAGDYEGIAIHKKDAYVMRSDGLIYEVLDFKSDKKQINTFKTKFSVKNNMETLALDIKNHSLIVAPKDRDSSDDFKGLYHIFIDSKVMNDVPIIKINMSDNVFKTFLKKKVYNTFNPSDVAIHPKTGKYYVLEGKNPKLLILDSDGTIEKVYKLDKNKFPQPEGITFGSDGTLYISNEAADRAATIMQVNFN